VRPEKTNAGNQRVEKGKGSHHKGGGGGVGEGSKPEKEGTGSKYGNKRGKRRWYKKQTGERKDLGGEEETGSPLL